MRINVENYEPKRYALFVLAVGGILALGTGCVERQVVYVPAQPGAPAGPVVAEQAPPPAQVEVVPRLRVPSTSGCRATGLLELAAVGCGSEGTMAFGQDPTQFGWEDIGADMGGVTFGSAATGARRTCATS